MHEEYSESQQNKGQDVVAAAYETIRAQRMTEAFMAILNCYADCMAEVQEVFARREEPDLEFVLKTLEEQCGFASSLLMQMSEIRGMPILYINDLKEEGKDGSGSVAICSADRVLYKEGDMPMDEKGMPLVDRPGVAGVTLSMTCGGKLADKIVKCVQEILAEGGSDKSAK